MKNYLSGGLAVAGAVVLGLGIYKATRKETKWHKNVAVDGSKYTITVDKHSVFVVLNGMVREASQLTIRDEIESKVKTLVQSGASKDATMVGLAHHFKDQTEYDLTIL